jgi:hypothetical protein
MTPTVLAIAVAPLRAAVPLLRTYGDLAAQHGDNATEHATGDGALADGEVLRIDPFAERNVSGTYAIVKCERRP